MNTRLYRVMARTAVAAALGMPVWVTPAAAQPPYPYLPGPMGGPPMMPPPYAAPGQQQGAGARAGGEAEAGVSAGAESGGAQAGIEAGVSGSAAAGGGGSAGRPPPQPPQGGAQQPQMPPPQGGMQMQGGSTQQGQVPPPERGVQQGGPEITVEEQPASIRVEKQSPEVIVRQPAPDVQIAQPPPKVEVQQTQPDVKFREAAPVVGIEEEGQPDIQVRQTEQPTVRTVEPARQQPEVQIRQPEQADVQVQPPPQPQADVQPPPQPQAQVQPRQPEDQVQRAEQGQAPPMTTAQPENPLLSLTADEIRGMALIGAQGEELGEVAQVVLHEATGNVHVVVPVGGFLGIGESKTVLPLSRMERMGDQLRLRTLRTEDQLEERAEYRPGAYRRIAGNQVLAEVAGGRPPGTQGAPTPVGVSFEHFDRNGDGYISSEEATPMLQQQWQTLDTNRDGVLERSEFAAFEAQMEGNVRSEPPSRPSPVAR